MTRARRASASYPLGEALDFLQRLWQLSQSLEKLSRRMEKRVGVTAPQRLIVRCLGKYPGITAGQLATLLHVDPGTISASLNRLEGKGVLQRRRDPKDKRRAALGLTAKGRELNRTAHGTVEGAVKRLIEARSRGDLDRVTEVLEQLTTLLGDEVQD
jgi:DNA-binding MarR family transcriptional regulator